MCWNMINLITVVAACIRGPHIVAIFGCMFGEGNLH